MKHAPQAILVIALSALVFVGWHLDRQRDAERSVLSGFFETTPTEVASRVQGRVQEIFVREGDPVARGQVIVSLESDPDIEAARAKQSVAKQALAALAETEIGPRPEEIARQEAAVQEAKAALDVLVDGPRPEDIAQARSRLDQREAVYDKALAGPRPEEVGLAQATAAEAWERYAAAKRGLTPEERRESKARMDSAQAQENVAQADAARYAQLFAESAVTAQQNDQAQANFVIASAALKENQQAYQRAMEGTPHEELQQAWQAYLEARESLDLTLAGTRKEDIAAALADRNEAKHALEELVSGSRPEDVRSARAHLQQASAQLAELRAGSRPEDIAQAKATALAAEETARSAQESVSERDIKAPTDGFIRNIPVAVGDLTAPGTSVASIENPSDLWLRVYVPETHVADIAVGDTADIRVDGMQGIEAGYVQSIAASGEFTPANLQSPDERGKQVFSVRLRLEKADSRIKPGMDATVIRIGNWHP